VLVHERGAQMEVSITDPTQLQTGPVIVEIARAATGVIAQHPRISVLQLAPTVKLAVDVNEARGASLKATFAVPVTSPPTISPPAGGFAPPTLSAGVSATAELPDYREQVVTSDDVAVTFLSQSPAPGTDLPVGPTAVTLTAYDAEGNSASLTFEVTVTFAPLITTQPENMTAAVGRTAQLSAAAVGVAPLQAAHRWRQCVRRFHPDSDIEQNQPRERR
jgi:hypothetical protein